MPLPNPSSEARENVRPRGRRTKDTAQARRNQAELRDYFKTRLKSLEVVKTTRSPSGQVLDWIPIESQVRRGKIASPPSDSERIKPVRGRRAEGPVLFELEQPDAVRGPAGTVPVVRKNLQRIPSWKNLEQFLSKHGRKTYAMFIDDDHSLEVPGDGSVHLYAYTSQSVTCYGGSGELSAFDPYLNWSDEFSLLQTALVRGSGNGKQTLEVGWQEYRDLYGDWVPHLFVYYTTNGYTSSGDNVGGYNRDVDGWVQYSSSIFPETRFSPMSTRGGAQYKIVLKVQLYQGNWWVRCNGEWIGYYPASLYSTSGLRSKADKIAWYGEVVDSSDHSGDTKTDMGSGYYSSAGWTYSGYMHNLKYQSGTAGSMSTYTGGSSLVTNSLWYDVETHFSSGGTWESYMWLGGPGAG
jgi:neprosin-like protein